MKVCPKCRTQFTDMTLVFCLQDGARLVEGADNKTERLSDADMSMAETIAVTADVPLAEPKTADAGSGLDTNRSEQTVVRDHEKVPKSGFGFLTGFFAALVVLGLLGIIGLGAWFLPGIISPGAGMQTNTNTAKEKTFPVNRDLIASVRSSSVRRQDAGNLYIPENATDKDDRTAWCEGVGGPGTGEWIKIEFTKELKLSEFKIKPGYFKNGTLWKKNNRVASVELLFSNGLTRVFDFPDEMRSQTVPLKGVESKFVKITLRSVHRGSADQKDTLISEIEFTAVN